MIKKTIQYEDLDGNPVSADWYFRLDSAELLEMTTSSGTGLYAAMEAITSGQDKNVTMRAFREIIMASVGKRDGQRFIKSDALRDEFVQSGAFSEMFMEIMTNTMIGVDFVMGIVPGNLAQKLNFGELRVKMAEAGLTGTDAELVLKQLEERKFVKTENPKPKIVDMSLDPNSPAGNVTVVEPTEPVYFEGKTKSEILAMSVEDLSNLILNASGNVPKELLAHAMTKRHKN